MEGHVRSGEALRDIDRSVVDELADQAGAISAALGAIPGSRGCDVIRTREGVIVVALGDDEGSVIESGRRFAVWIDRFLSRPSRRPRHLGRRSHRRRPRPQVIRGRTDAVNQKSLAARHIVLATCLALMGLSFATTSVSADPIIDAPPVPCSVGPGGWIPLPEARNDTFSRELGNLSDPDDSTFLSLKVPAPGVLGNDPAGFDTARAALWKAPSHAASFTLHPDGSFEYMPVDGYFGGDSFQYVNYVPGGPCSTGANVIIASATSLRPQDDFYQTPVNTSVDERSYAGHINICQAVGACGVLDNDLNFTTGGRIDLILSINDDLSVASPSIANGVETSTPHGRIILNPDGSFLYTPASGFIGTDHFGYTVFPESQIGPHEAEVPEHPDGSIKYAIVTIDVYDPPPPTVAKGVDDDLLATEDTTLHIDPATLTANDTSVTWITEVNDNNASIQQPFHTPHGSVTVTFHEAIPGTAFKNVAAIVYTPNPDFTGVDTFTYSVSKGDFLTTNFKARVYLFVGSAADPPDAANDEATTFENVPITVDVSLNDSDLDGDIDLHP